MNRNNPFQRFGALLLGVGGALLVVQTTCPASTADQHEQQSQSQPPQPPPPAPAQNPEATSPSVALPEQLPVKRRKVWTNDEVTSLRTPADAYQVEKEAQAAAEARAAAKEATIRASLKSEKEPPLDIKLPNTRQETENMLKNTQADLQEETVVLDKLHKELLDSPEELQEQKQKDIDRLTASIETLRRDERALQGHLRTFEEKPEEQKPPAGPQPPTF